MDPRIEKEIEKSDDEKHKAALRLCSVETMIWEEYDESGKLVTKSGEIIVAPTEAFLLLTKGGF